MSSHSNLHGDSYPSGVTSIDFKGPRGPLQHRCGLCSEVSESLSRCSSCKVVRYCSRQHQIEHRPQHKSVCNKIKKNRARVEKEDHALKNATPDFMTPANAFETHVGHFWGMLPTRDYMQARFDLADALRRTRTLDGVQEALSHFQDMLRLSQSDNMGVRDLVPAIMLQLDQDQECYDFIKWWEVERGRDDLEYDSDDLLILPPVPKSTNVLESVNYLEKKYGLVFMLLPSLLLRLKLLCDVVQIKLARKVIQSRLPPELWARVDDYMIRSDLSSRWCGYSYGKLTAVQQRLETHVKYIAKYVRDITEHLPRALLEPDEYLGVLPAAHGRGTFEETSMALLHNYAAIWQHEGALELLESARAIAAVEAVDEIEGMMASKTFKTNPGSDRTKEELLLDVSFNRLWGCFDEAVEDAFSLGVEKPSAMRRQRRKALWDALSDDEEDDEIVL